MMINALTRMGATVRFKGREPETPDDVGEETLAGLEILDAASGEPLHLSVEELRQAMLDYAEASARQAEEKRIANELQELDLSIPRGLEDYWDQMNFDTSTLPEAARDKLARKLELRLELAALST